MKTIKIERVTEALRLVTESGFTFAVDDNGHTHHKTAVIRNRQWELSKLPSIIKSGALFSSENGHAECYEVDNKKYTCSPMLEASDDLTGSDYQHSDLNIALICAALAKSNIGPKDKLILGTTMPVSQYYEGPDLNTKAIKAFQDRLTTPGLMRVSGQEGHYQVPVAKVFCEGFCAFYDFLVQDDFTLKTGITSNVTGGDAPVLPVAIVEIGGRTTDVVAIVNMKAVDHTRSKSIPMGILTLTDKVEGVLRAFIKREAPELLGDEYNAISKSIINSVLAGEINSIGGISLDPVKDEIERLKSGFTTELMTAVDKVLRSRLSYGHIIFAGGGAVLLKKQLSSCVKDAHFLDEYANAKGALKMMIVYLAVALLELAEKNLSLLTEQSGKVTEV